MMEQSNYIHPNAIVEPGAQIGENTRVWAFAHILPRATLGQECNICDGVFIENDVAIGNRVTIKCGVQVWDGIILEDDVFVGPNVTFTNDKFPRSKQYPKNFSQTIVRKGASIGANATILPGIIIGPNAMVGAGSVVTRDVPPNAIVVGNPARIKGYVKHRSQKLLRTQSIVESPGDILVPTVKLINLPRVDDMRGSLTFGEYDKHLPFEPKRFFVVFNVPTIEVRGEHAHKKLHQFLVCLNGSCSVMVDDGQHRDEILLNNPERGLHIPPMVWAAQYHYSSDAVLLVLASDVYEASDYIRDYDEFIRMLR